MKHARFNRKCHAKIFAEAEGETQVIIFKRCFKRVARATNEEFPFVYAEYIYIYMQNCCESPFVFARQQGANMFELIEYMTVRTKVVFVKVF